MKKFSFALVFLVLVALIGGIYHFHFNLKPEIVKNAIASMPHPAQGVAAVEARLEKLAPRVAAIGSFKAEPGIDVSSQVPGIVADIAFRNGQDVEKGALLVKLDDSTEQADLRSNLAFLKNAEQAFARQQALAASGVAARANFDLAQAARDQAIGAQDKTRALIAQKTIVAPFSGRLGIRKVDVGQYVAAGAPMVSLQALDPIFLDFPVPEQQIGHLAVGDEVAATVDALDGAKIMGKIETIDARVDAATRSVLVRAGVPNPGKKILPGMFAHVDFAVGAKSDAVTVPRAAVAFSLYGDQVFVVVPDDPAKGFDGPLHAERRAVRIGDAIEDRVILLSGVAPGEKIIAEGQIKLLPGASVKIVDQGGLVAPAQRPLP